MKLRSVNIAFAFTFAIASAALGLGCEQILGLDEYKEGGAGGGKATTATNSTASTTSVASAGGGGASSTTTTSGPGTSTASSVSSSSGGALEDCENGQDDDGDATVDCADPDCADHTCIDLPVGWLPVALGIGPTAPSSCPPGFDVEVYHGSADLTFQPASCSACQCLNPHAVCTPGSFGSSTQANCFNAIGFAQSGCTNLPVNNSTQFLGQAGTSSATCTPSGGVPGTLAPAVWSSEGRACAANGLGGGCTGANCVSVTPTEFHLCVMRDGDIGCPSGFATRHVLTNEPSNLADSRTCSACTCVGGTASCIFKTQVYASADCTGTPTQIANTGTCISGPVSNSSAPFISSFNPSCPPGGGSPIGTVTPAGPVATFCCSD